MINTVPEVDPMGRYPIGKAAQLLGISPRHLLRLATAGTVKFTVSRRSGRKLFAGRELIRLWREG